ncbi:hypothetical protein Tco_0255993 [Tanacetum coccineum]
MNQTPKQKEVRQVIYENNLCLCAILESHVANSNLQGMCSKKFKNWHWTSNGLSCVKGSRIILGWNPNIVKVVVISFDAQVMHTSIYFKDDKKELFCSFVYAHNRYLQRRDLWCNLITHKAYIRNRPWCILGDFNVSLSADEKSTGTSYIDTGMRDFQECVEDLELSDVNSTGLRFTWNQKPKGDDGILKKIDRIMANLEFYESFVGSSALFQPYRISDHSPAVLRIPMHSTRKPRPFKFYNLLVHNTRFKDVVTNGWQISVSGFWMFKVVKRLKLLKKPLRKLLYDQGNLHKNVKRLRHELDEAQRALDSDPGNLELREEEAAYLQAFNDALLMEERFLSQKAKVDWLQLGDANTAYFHKVVKSQATRNRIDSVTTNEGACVDGEQVPVAFIDHYTAFLGQQGVPSYFDTNDLFCKQLTIDTANHMARDVTDKEIREAIFSMGNSKAPSPDGILLLSLRKLGTLLRVMIISNRMKESLSDLVSLNKSAFVPGRRISDNILLTQELMHNYHLDRGTPRCAFKVDIQKAYDTVDWKFLHDMLVGFGFHPHMIGWIMECVTSTSFSLSINGSLHGYFKGKCGLRQGDPMSPYLFTLVMEVLTLMLNRRARDSNSFTYHRYCSKLNIINLCFADDLFLFAHDDVNSARVIMDSLEEFKNASGITLIPSRLLYRDCSELVEKIKRKGEMRKGKAKVAWEDVCLPKKEGGLGPIEGVVSNRDIYSVGFRLNAKVRDIIDNGSWGWPNEWNLKYPGLVNIVIPQLSDTVDRIIWRDRNNMDSEFYVAFVWDCIRPRNNDVDWFHVVWEHLKRFTGMANMPSALNLIVDFLIPLAKMRSARSVIAKLIQEDDECADVDSSLEVAYLACWSISELMSMLMDIKFSLVRVFGAGLKVECSSVAVLFFPSPRFFPLGFSWEGFLRRQDRLAVYTPMMLLRDDFEALCTLKWFFPIGVIVSVLFS